MDHLKSLRSYLSSHTNFTFLFHGKSMICSMLPFDHLNVKLKHMVPPSPNLLLTLLIPKKSTQLIILFPTKEHVVITCT